MKAFLFVATCLCWAQQDTGTIEGTVLDPSGAIVVKAQLTLNNLDTGLKRSVESGSTGQFTFTPLRVGNYEITVSAPGFQTQVRRPIQLQIQQTIKLTFTLELGSSSSLINVDAAAPMLQTSDSSVGQVVDSQKVTELPLNGRNVYQLVSLTPGVAIQPNRQPSVSGQTAQNQFYALDGVDNNNYQGNLSSGGAYTASPSPDGVEEFKVQTSNYSAEFGQSAGGVVNVITRSGTNTVHGSLYEFLRNEVFDARNFFAPTKAPYKQNQFGGSIGGPVVLPHIIDGHNKLFFFADLEGFRSRKGQTTNITLPSMAWRQGDFRNLLKGTTYTDPCTGASYDIGQLFDPTTTRQSTCLGGGTGFVRDPISYNGQANVVSPAKISQASANTLALLPVPNSGTNGFVWSPTNVYDYVRGDIKLDYQWGAHDHIFGRYNIMDSPKTGVPRFPGPASQGTTRVSRQQGVAIGDAHIFSPLVVNEFRFGWARNNTHGYLAGTDLNASTLGLGGIPYEPGVLGGLPNFQFSDVGGFGSSVWAPAIYTSRNMQFSDTLSIIRGKHTIKLGGAYNRYGWLQFQIQYPMGFYSFSGVLTRSLTAPQVRAAASSGSGFAQFLFGIPNYSGLSTGIMADNIRSTGALFIQDDWHVTSKLTINAGLRWEFGSPMRERENRVGGYDFQTGVLVVPKSRQNLPPTVPPNLPVEYVDSNTLFENSIRNFGPRLGLAYQVNDKTVIRAAGGIFYGNPFVAGTVGYPLNPPFGATAYFFSPATGPIDPVTNRPVVPVTNIATGFPSDLLTSVDLPSLQLYLYDKKPLYPSTSNWNFAVQRSLPAGFSVEAAYAGSKGSHVVSGNDLNQPYPTTDPNSAPASRRPYSNLGAIDVITTGADSHYHSLQVKGEKRYSNGLTMLLGYTWAHSIDNAPGIYTLGISEPGGAYYDFYRDARNTSIDKGNSFFDIRHRFVLSWLYDLPFGKGRPIGSSWHGLTNQLLGGWRLGGIMQYQTGFHFTTVTYNDPAYSGIYSFVAAAVPNLVGNPEDFSYGKEAQSAAGCPAGQRSLRCWLNPAAFATPTPGAFGNQGRNTLIGPSMFTLDGSVFKEFPLNERARFTFRAEFFNLTNHANFALPDNTLESSTFGKIFTTRTDPRDIQFALRFVF